jgi:hypothetical protein
MKAQAFFPLVMQEVFYRRVACNIVITNIATQHYLHSCTWRRRINQFTTTWFSLNAHALCDKTPFTVPQSLHVSQDHWKLVPRFSKPGYVEHKLISTATREERRILVRSHSPSLSLFYLTPYRFRYLMVTIS